MGMSAVPKREHRPLEKKQPGKPWLMMEKFLVSIGLLYPPNEPFSEVVGNVRVEQGGRKLIRTEVKKMKKNKIINFPQELSNEIGIVTPMNINQAAEPADMLRGGRSILCNFNGIDKKNLEQVRFFLMGVVYAIGGTCKKINDTIYLFTPSSVDVINSHLEQMPTKKDQVKNNDDVIMDQFFGT